MSQHTNARHARRSGRLTYPATYVSYSLHAIASLKTRIRRQVCRSRKHHRHLWAFTTSMVVVGRRSKMSQKAASRPLRAGLLHRVQYANLQFCAVVCVEQECAHVFCRFPGQVSGWFWAGVAQLVEHLICNQRVGGSNPFASSTRRIETGAEKRQ